MSIDFKTIQRLMGKLGLKSLVRLKKYKSYKGGMGAVVPNHLARQFEAADVNEKWVTDVTEFKVPGGKVFLSPVMDLCNGQIIAHTMDTRPSLGMVTSMLKNALAGLPQNATPMVHSDQGWQYRMPLYQKLLEQRGLPQSMSRKGNCHDNACIESFFAVLKSEYFHLNSFTSANELMKGLTEYIRYYNDERIKMKLNGLSPVAYRAQLAMR